MLVSVVLYAEWFYTRTSLRNVPFFFHACAHGRGDARFHLGAFRSEITPIPTPTPEPSCVKTYVGAWSDTPRRGRPALYRGKRGRAISLWNAPRRSPAHPQTHGGNTVGSRSAQGDGPSVGPLIGPSVGAMIGLLVGAVIGPSVGIYGRGRRPRRPAPVRNVRQPDPVREARRARGTRAPTNVGVLVRQDRRGGPGRSPAPTPRAEGGAGTARAGPWRGGCRLMQDPDATSASLPSACDFTSERAEATACEPQGPWRLDG